MQISSTTSASTLNDAAPTRRRRCKWRFVGLCGAWHAVLILQGYLWGSDTQQILSHLDEAAGGFDLLILADLLFNHSEHAKLVSTITQTLRRSPDASALVFFTPYRPWLLEKDLAFFALASDAGFDVSKIVQKVMDRVMFDDDPGVSMVCKVYPVWQVN